MRKKKSRYLAPFSINTAVNRKQNPTILRIILSEEHVQIDMGYAAPDIYYKGGWIDISPSTYLHLHRSEKRFKLLQTRNITLVPKKVNFESKTDWCVFSLFFEPLPLKDCVIDIIENPHPTQNNFNYYGIEVSYIDSVELMSNVEMY